MLRNFHFIGFVLLIAACSKKKIPSSQIDGLDYYPVSAGRFTEFDVDSIVYQEIPKDTFHYKYRIKELLADQFTDNEGKPAWRLERYIKWYKPGVSYDSISWKIKEVFMVHADHERIQVQENNIRFTKLVFPVREKLSWTGQSNGQKQVQFSYEYVDRAETVSTHSLDNVLMVRQVEYPTLISYESQNEKYARNIGLVFKRYVSVRSNSVQSGVEVMDRIESGVVFEQTMINFGYE